MNVFGVGLPEMLLILVVALLIFGPQKLPEVGRSLGKAIRGFQDASREFEEELKREAANLEKSATTNRQPTAEAPQALSPVPEPPLETHKVGVNPATNSSSETVS